MVCVLRACDVVCSEEVFGPVMAVAAFTHDDEAVAMANDCSFGLGSSVFSRNAHRAKALGSRIEVSALTKHL